MNPCAGEILGDVFQMAARVTARLTAVGRRPRLSGSPRVKGASISTVKRLPSVPTGDAPCAGSLLNNTVIS